MANGLPPRRIIRSIVRDALSDREEMLDSDASTADVSRALIARYSELLPRLEDNAPALLPEDRSTLDRACVHARIWREGLLDAYAGTGDKGMILKCRQDVDRVKRLEAALGVVRTDTSAWESVSLSEIRRRAEADPARYDIDHCFG